MRVRNFKSLMRRKTPDFTRENNCRTPTPVRLPQVNNLNRSFLTECNNNANSKETQQASVKSRYQLRKRPSNIQTNNTEILPRTKTPDRISAAKKEVDQRSRTPTRVTPSSKLITGVCSNCINEELMKKNKSNDKIVFGEEDLLAVQALRSENFQTQLHNKINLRNYYSQKAANYKVSESEKDKLIKSQQNNEFTLNKPKRNYNQERLLERFKKNQEKMNKNFKIRFVNKNVEDFYANEKNNEITDGSVCAIGRNDHRKIPITQENYRKCLQQQIHERERAKVINKENDKKLEQNLAIKNKKDADYEMERRKKYYEILKNDFIRENQRLMESKSKIKELNKSNDMFREKNNLRDVNEQLNNEEKQNKLRKMRVRKDLMEGLEKQLQEKNEKDKKERLANQKMCPVEDHICVDRFGRCIKCGREFQAKFISPVEEFERIKKVKVN